MGANDDPEVAPNPSTERLSQLLVLGAEPATRQGIQRMLVNLRPPVKTKPCARATAALNWAARHPPDLVIADVQSIGVGTQGFIQQFRALSKCGDVPILALADLEDPHQLAAAHQAGVSTVLRKSAHALEFILQVQSMLDVRAELLTLRHAVHRNELQLAKHAQLQQERIQHDKAAALDLARRASADKSEFLAMACHDLRSPLQRIVNHLSLLEQALADRSDLTTRLDSIRAAVDTVQAVSRDLVDVVKLEQGFIKPEPRPVDLAKLLDEVLHPYRHVAIEKDLGYDSRLDLTCNEVLADPARLSHILSRLLDNAVRYTERGSVRCRASCRRTEADRAELVVVVEDTGPGLDAQSVDRLNTPFVANALVATTASRRLGLGLTMVHALVTLLDGTLVVHAKPNEGTSFTITVQLQVSSRAAADVFARSP